MVTTATNHSLLKNVLQHYQNFSANRPYLLAIAGPVGVGKSTLADQLKQQLLACNLKVAVVATDHFLLPNSELAQKKILKGFPDSYDHLWLTRFFQQVSIRQPAAYPCYRHQDYDRDVHIQQQLATNIQILIVEGINALSVTQPDMVIYVLATAKECINAITSRTLQLFNQYPDAKHPLNQQPIDIENIRGAVVSNWQKINRHSSWLHKPPLLQPVHYLMRTQVHLNLFQHPVLVVLRNLYWRLQLWKMLRNVD